LLDGQVAINTSDESTSTGLYFKLANGALTKVGPVAVSAGVAPNSIPVGSSGNAIGETWLDQRTSYATPIMKVYDGTYWQTTNGFTVDEATGNFSLNRELTIVNFDANGTSSQSYVRIPRDGLVSRATIDAKAGMLRFNTDTDYYEGFDGSQWLNLASLTKDAEFSNLEVTGDLTVQGETLLGIGCSSIVTIDAYTNLKCNVDIRGSLVVEQNATISGSTIQLGSGSAGSLTCLSTSEFKADSTFQEDLTVGTSSINLFRCISTAVFNNGVTMDKNVTIGTNVNDGLTVESTSTFKGPIVAANTIEARDTVTFRKNTHHYGSILPGDDKLHDLGSPSKRWANMYTGDLHLKNERGDWTVIEEADYLSLRQNSTGKVFKILMQEVEG
jgi:hypothetical protein